ncbi:hypothetical protein OAI90_06485, partial [Crocinitomicaceae bacterium]|nr:hypothetical protein [Crocinitomicaceae bacterium]
IIGNESEAIKTNELLVQTQEKLGEIISFSSIEEFKKTGRKIDEIIFCSGSQSYGKIIATMSNEKEKTYDFKISPNNSNHLIGSNSIDTAGELYILNLNTLVSNENKRKKRLFDMLISTGLLITLPFLIFLFKNKTKYVKNIGNIFIGKKSFIGFSNELTMKDVRLPRIKQGLITPDDPFQYADASVRQKLNLLYARDYSMRKDFSIVWKTWRKLDN